MKPFTILFLALLVAAGTALLVATVRTDSAPHSQAAAAATPDALAELSGAVARLEKHEAETSKALDDLRMQIAAKEAPARVSLGDIDAAVARALTERLPGGASTSSAAAVPASAQKDVNKPTAKSIFAEIVQGNLSWNDAQALWKQVDDPAVMSELIALFEENARTNANDPKAQVELGKAYLQKLFKVGAGPEAGVWATKADKSFDKALAIDDHDWSARFCKAMSLSNWPAFLGKQNEAIANFDILVKQQDAVPAQPMHAQTHLLLGNMYMSMGQKDKALAAWQKGLTIFPDNEDLKKQITGAQAH